jgi:multisubunit Na+/H+ antiporter MnhC subunit
MPEGLDALDGILIVTCLVLGFGVVKLILALQGRKRGEGSDVSGGEDQPPR